MNDLTLVIPAKNEAESLPKVLEELQKFNYNISVVLHKTDHQTIKSIENYNVELVFQENFGYGDALILGMNNCKSKYFCIFNADGSFNPNELEMMKKKVESEKLDFVFASRYQKNSGSDDDTFVTLVGNYFFTLLGKVFFKLNISDILYTYVLGKTESVKNLDLNRKDFTLCVELPIKASRKGMKISSISSFERARIAGKKKVNALKDGSLILFYLIKIFFKKN
tara:strand:- start:587 stop:1258 length:672 start_codon:yes stop_codon:yes gene_type:complete